MNEQLVHMKCIHLLLNEDEESVLIDALRHYKLCWEQTRFSDVQCESIQSALSVMVKLEKQLYRQEWEHG